MAPQRPLCIPMEVCPNPETGIWCAKCRTAAGARFRIVTFDDNGVSDLGTYECCLRCDIEDGD